MRTIRNIQIHSMGRMQNFSVLKRAVYIITTEFKIREFVTAFSCLGQLDSQMTQGEHLFIICKKKKGKVKLSM
jgi:hypothetical protein